MMEAGFTPGAIGQTDVSTFFKSPPPSIAIPVNNKVTGWRVVGIHYSCSPHPIYPWDPAVIRGIWEFEPTWVPLWVTHEVINDGMSTPLVFGNHAIGRVVENPVHGTDYFSQAGFSVTMPTMPCKGITFGRPSHLEVLIPWWDRYPSLPFGPYYPFDWSVVRMLREIHTEPDPRRLRELMVTKPQERWEAEERKRREEQQYIAADVQEFTNRKLNELSDVERSEYLRAGDDALKPDPKPFVHVRGV